MDPLKAEALIDNVTRTVLEALYASEGGITLFHQRETVRVAVIGILNTLTTGWDRRYRIAAIQAGLYGKFGDAATEMAGETSCEDTLDAFEYFNDGGKGVEVLSGVHIYPPLAARLGYNEGRYQNGDYHCESVERTGGDNRPQWVVYRDGEDEAIATFTGHGAMRYALTLVDTLDAEAEEEATE